MIRSTLILFFITLLSVFYISGCASHLPLTAQPLTSPQLANTISQQTLALLSPGGDHSPICSAVWVSKDVILTANHCIVGYANYLHKYQMYGMLVKMGVPDELAQLLVTQDVDTLKQMGVPAPILDAVQQANTLFPISKLQGLVMNYAGATEFTNVDVAPLRQHHATAYALYPDIDLALLKASADYPLHTFVTLATDNPVMGEEINAVGHGEGNWWSYRHGFISAVRGDLTQLLKSADMKLCGPFLQMQLPIIPGDSGSGTFNMRGQLVGINSFISHDSGFAYAIPVSSIRGMLQAQHLAPIVLQPNVADPPLN